MNIACTRTGTADSHAILVINHSRIVTTECLSAVINSDTIFENDIPGMTVGIKTIVE